MAVLTSRHSTNVLFKMLFEMVVYGMNAWLVDFYLYGIDSRSTLSLVIVLQITLRICNVSTLLYLNTYMRWLRDEGYVSNEITPHQYKCKWIWRICVMILDIYVVWRDDAEFWQVIEMQRKSLLQLLTNFQSKFI